MQTLLEKDVLSTFARATFDASFYAVHSDLIYNKRLIERSEIKEVHLDPKTHFLEHILEDLGGYKFALDRNEDSERYEFDVLYLSKQKDTLHCKLRWFNSETKQSEWWEGDIDISTWSLISLTANNLYAAILPQYGLLVHEVNRQRNLWQDPAIMQMDWTCLPEIYDQLASVSLAAKKSMYQRQLCIQFVFQLSGQPEKITYKFVIPVVFLANILRSKGFPLLDNNNDIQACTEMAIGCKRGSLSGSKFCERRQDFIWKFIFAALALGLGLLAIFILVHYPLLHGGVWALACVTQSFVFGIQAYRGFFRNNADSSTEFCNDMLSQMRGHSVHPEGANESQGVPRITGQPEDSDYQALESGLQGINPLGSIYKP